MYQMFTKSMGSIVFKMEVELFDVTRMVLYYMLMFYRIYVPGEFCEIITPLAAKNSLPQSTQLCPHPTNYIVFL